MTREDKKLLLKDLCARLPYGVKVNVKGVVYDNRSCRLTDIHHGLDTYIGVHDGMQYHIESTKPYLFPLSSMTEEQRKELWNAFAVNIEVDFQGDLYLDNIKGYIHISEIQEYYNFLLKNHFDYRGLIPKGLAINATGLNIY